MCCEMNVAEASSREKKNGKKTEGGNAGKSKSEELHNSWSRLVLNHFCLDTETLLFNDGNICGGLPDLFV